jgi:AraC-like DNA-binding protein/tetratricopeptide (TPR) repeat protein
MKQSGLNTPSFAGRSREMKVFRSMLSDLDVQGTGSCVLIRGLPGTGKTRLLAEFASCAQAAGKTVLPVALSPSVMHKPYGALNLILDEYLRRASLYPEPKRLQLRKALSFGAEALIPMITWLHPGYADIFPDRRSSPRGEESHMEDKGRFAELLMVFLANLAAFERGAVIIMDDAHFCDRESLGMLDRSASSLNAMNLIVAASYPQSLAGEVRRQLPCLFAGGCDVYEIQSDVLDVHSHRLFCAGMLGVDELCADELSSFVFDATGGNPLFSQEAILYLINKGALSSGDRRIAFDKTTAPSLYQFGSYMTLALKNAGYLTSDEKMVLSLLSVLGMKFTDEWIRVFLPTYAGSAMDSLSFALDNARAMGFLSRDAGSYKWNHAQIRDSFYQGTDEGIRRSLHLDIARFLAGKASPDSDSLFDTAYHFMKAGTDAAALPWALAAGEKALGVFAYDSAGDFFTFCAEWSAGKDAASAAAVFRAKVMLCCVLLAKGMYAEAIARLEVLLPIAREQELLDVYRFLSLACYRTGDLARCEELTRKGLALLGERVPAHVVPGLVFLLLRLLFLALRRPAPLCSEQKIHQARAGIFFWGNIARLYGPRKFRVFVYAALKVRTIVIRNFRNPADRALSDMIIGSALMTVRRFGAAYSYFRSALASMDEAGNEWESARIGQLMGTLYLWRGKGRDAEKILLDSIRRFEDLGEISARCSALFPLAELYIGTARYGEAMKTALDGYDLASCAGDSFSSSRAASQIAMIEAELGNDASSREWLGTASEDALKANSNICLFFFYYAESVAALRGGRFSDALDAAGKARRIMRRCRIAGFYASALVPVVLEAAAAGRLPVPGRVSCALRALRYYRWRARRPELFYSLGLLFFSRGRRFAAAFFFRRARSGALSAGRRRILARTLCGLAEMKASRDVPAALELFEKAFLLCEECGADSDADALLGRIMNFDGDAGRAERVTARRRLDFLLEAQALSFLSGDSSVPGLMLTLAAGFCRAKAAALYLAEEDLFPLKQIAVIAGTDDTLARLARDVYTSEEAASANGMIGIPLARSGRVVGALCLQGCAPWLASGRMMDTLESGITIASRGLDCPDESSAVRQGRKNPYSSADDERMNRVLDYIRQNYHDDISREGLAALVGLHPDNLGKMFKVRTGKKIGDFINSLRIEEAMGLLSGGETPVIDIAFVVGFESLRTFNRSFAAFAGVTPSAYREMCRRRK